MTLDAGLVACFVAVAEEHSFTKGAQRVGLSQPQISLRIRKLEQQLGFPLFSRTTRSLSLPPEAERFLPLAKDIVVACDEAQAYLASLKTTRDSALRIGSPEVSLNSSLRGDILNAFMDRYPSVQLQLTTATTAELVDKLLTSQLNALLTYRFVADGQAPAAGPGLQFTPLQKAVAALCVPRESDLAGRGPVDISALTGHEMTLSPGNACPDVVHDIRAVLNRLSVRCVPAPETHRATILQFARTRRLISFQWLGVGDALVEPGSDMVLERIKGDPFVLEFGLVIHRGDQRVGTRRFRDVVRVVTARQTSAAPAVSDARVSF